MPELFEMSCRSCKVVGPLGEKDAQDFFKKVRGWSLDGKKITKYFEFPNFGETMDFVNRVAAVAEQEQHHPDISVSYGRVGIELWTHSVNGLTQNDFIVAAKIDRI